MKTFDLYITKLCNLHCEYCYVDIGSDQRNFVVGKFLQKVPLKEYDHIKFFGGEPLLKWQEIQDIVLYCKDNFPKMKFSLITNGMLLSDKKYEFLKENNISVIVSVHPNPGAKKILLKIKNNIKSTTFSFVISPGFLQKIYHDIVFCIEYGARDIILLPDSSVLWDEKYMRYFRFFSDRIMGLIHIHSEISLHFAFTNILSSPDIGCKKEIYEIDQRVPCNRFRTLSALSPDFYKMMKVSLEEVGFFQDPYRFFFSCPIGYFLDHHEKGFTKVAESFVSMNRTLLDYQRQFENSKYIVSFLTLKNPMEIRFNLTEQCNLRCRYCYVDFSNSICDFQTAKNIVDFIIDVYDFPMAFSFFGGEPLLEFDLMKRVVHYIIDYYRDKKGMIPSFKIATNALLLNDNILAFLLKNNFEIHITFGGIPEKHNLFRDGSWEKLKIKIQSLNLIKQKNVRPILMIDPKTIDSLFTSYIFLKKIGFRNIYPELIYSITGGQWDDNNFRYLEKQLLLILNYDKGENFYAPEERYIHIYDIGVNGQISENSLHFFNLKYDLSGKKKFDKIFVKIFWRK